MQVDSILKMFINYQWAFYGLVTLQLTGYLYLPPAELKDGDTFDYIVIGAGVAGCDVASKLAEQSFNVLLIEAGPDAPYETTLPKLMAYPYNSHVDWNMTSEDDNFGYRCHVNNVLDLHQARMIGGTGGMNYMIYSRGNRQGLDVWFEKTKEPEWKTESLMQYFINAENVNDRMIRQSKYAALFGSQGPIGVTRNDDDSTNDVLKGFQQIRKDIIPDIDGNRNGYAKGLLTIQNGERSNLGPSCQSNVTNNKYIATAKNTYATKIIFNKQKEATGVEAITDSGENVLINIRKEVIVSCGALRSPQLLKLSGIGPETELNKLNIPIISDLPVGKVLNDIQTVFIAHKTNKPIENKERSNGDYPSGIIVGYDNRYSNSTRYDPPNYTANIFTIDDAKFLVHMCAVIHRFPQDKCEKLLKEANGNQVIITLLGNLYGQSSGQVTLRSSSAKDLPFVQTPGYSFRQDIDDIIDNVMHFLQVEQSESWKSLGAIKVEMASPQCDKFKKDSREYWRCYIQCMMVSLREFSGTCPLGTVVDSRLRIRGVAKARVVDASVIPSNIGGMIHNAVRVLADVAAGMIIKDAGDEYRSMKHDEIRMDQIQNLPNTNILY